MEDINIYNDYEAFVKENKELITTLISTNSKTIARFVPVIKVVDFLYHQKRVRKLNDDEELFFSTGFDYIFDQFHYINTLLESKFNNDIKEMEKFGTTINLLLYINEFQSEALSSTNEKVKHGVKLLDDLDTKVNNALEAGKNAPEEYFQILNDIVDKVFEANGVELHTVDEIFYEIALEYDIETEATNDTFLEAFNEQIEKNRK
ncbi:MAG: hypothetical protein K6A63_05920 [Acholeplasmatales bacterium]|nr:hypothetical protein [Acholeplasmatales bacterium]